MTSEIQAGSTDPFEGYIIPACSNTDEDSTSLSEPIATPEPTQPLPDWKVREREEQTRRELATSELKKFVAQGDLNSIKSFIQSNETWVYYCGLPTVYALAANQQSEAFIQAFEDLLQEEDLLEFLVGEMRDPKALEKLLQSQHISLDRINRSLNEYFQSSAIYGNSYLQLEPNSHRLEIAQILMDHGANPFDQNYNSAWLVATANNDLDGLKLMMNHPKFNLSEQHLFYVGSLLGYKFNEKFKTPEIWGEESEAGIRQSKTLCHLYEQLGITLSEIEILELVKQDQNKPVQERTFLSAILLPFVDVEVKDLSSQLQTGLAMDFIRLYPLLGMFNCFIFQGLVEPVTHEILEHHNNPQIIADRIINDAFHTDVAIPEFQKTSLDDESEDVDKAYAAYQISYGLINRGYSYHLLLENPAIKELLEKTEEGQEFIQKFEVFYQELLTVFGPLPWKEKVFSDDDFSSKLIRLGKDYFSNENV